MEKRWGVFFQPGRSMDRGTGQRPWGEPGTHQELEYSGISKTPVSSSPSTCRHWPLFFALVFVPRRNYHLRGFHTPDCLSVLVFNWFWDLILGDFVCNLVVMGCHWIFTCFRTSDSKYYNLIIGKGVVIWYPNSFQIQNKNIFQPHRRRWFRYWKSSFPLCSFSRFEGWTSEPKQLLQNTCFGNYERIFLHLDTERDPPTKRFYHLNLIFWKKEKVGRGMARFSRRGLF